MKYYITTTIPYANAEPHIGFALEILYADIMARYQRLLGKDVYFLTGTDEHGQKMYKTAKENNRDPFDFASEKSAAYERLIDVWNISNNDFIRTTEDRHKDRAKIFWQKSMDNGDIYKKKYTGFYCVGCESFKTEKDLVDGKCPYHEQELEKISEENYFFRLSKYQAQLEEFFENNPDFIYPKSRHNEMKQILDQGLEDISVSRSKEKLSWGIPVPNDDDQVMYVWFDALTNYITALGWGGEDDQLFKSYWPADAHILGKDVNKFHSLLWPAMLMSAGLELPKKNAVHGFMTLNGKRISKSSGNIIDPMELADEFDLEALRFFLTAEIPYESDGDFSRDKFIHRYTADLANGLGNLTNRVLVMIEKYCDYRVPEVENAEEDLIKELKDNIWPKYVDFMEKFEFHNAIGETWKFIAYCDQLITDRQPWNLVKEGRQTEVNDLLHHLAEALRQIAVMLWPIMPETAEKIFQQLGLDVLKEKAKPLGELKNWVQLTVGNEIKRGEALFPRFNIK